MNLIEEISSKSSGRSGYALVARQPAAPRPTQLVAPGRKRAVHYTSVDSSARRRAQHRRLVELERENYHDNVKIEIPGSFLRGAHRSGKTAAVRKIFASKKTLANHMDDDPDAAREFADISSSKSSYPVPQLCSVCGYWGKIACIQCGSRYCSIPCQEAHRETRCLKSYG
jgi:zinc finger HIT domain-containing protein 1